jgi:hypothetical protein
MKVLTRIVPLRSQKVWLDEPCQMIEMESISLVAAVSVDLSNAGVRTFLLDTK